MALIMVGTLVRMVGRKRSMTSNSVAGSLRSLKRAVAPPTAKGKSRLVPVA